MNMNTMIREWKRIEQNQRTEKSNINKKVRASLFLLDVISWIIIRKESFSMLAASELWWEGKTHAEAIFSSVFKDVRHRYKRGACGVTINLSTILSSLAINHSFKENVFVYLRVPCDASSRIWGWEGQIRKENLKRVESSNLLILKLKGLTFAGAGACQPPLPRPCTSCCIKFIKKKTNYRCVW